MLDKIEIAQITEESDYPYHLLLLADETKEAIDKYLFDSTIYLIKYNSVEIGAFCLYEVNEDTIELKNIAIVENFRNMGLGSSSIRYIKDLCKGHYRDLIVGTGDVGVQQIRFYEQNGFEKYSLRKDFFLKNYDYPIFENGKQLIDMVVLKYKL